MAKGLAKSLARRSARQSTTVVGSSSATGVSVAQVSGPNIQKTVLTLDDLTVALTDNAGVVAYAGQKIYDWPEGAILFLGAVANLAITKSSAGVNDDWDGDFALGTVTASNNNSLSSTEQDLIPTTATPQAVSGATTATGKSTSSEAGTVLDGTGTAKDVYLNVLVDDADHNVTGTACNLIFNGTITLWWANLGDV